MQIKIKKWIEIPVTIWGRYDPGEKPDTSERSPCPGEPESADIERFEIVGIPENMAQCLIDRYEPGLWDSAEEEIIEKAKAEIEHKKEAAIDAQELQRKYG